MRRKKVYVVSICILLFVFLVFALNGFLNKETDADPIIPEINRNPVSRVAFSEQTTIEKKYYFDGVISLNEDAVSFICNDCIEEHLNISVGDFVESGSIIYDDSNTILYSEYDHVMKVVNIVMYSEYIEITLLDINDFFVFVEVGQDKVDDLALQMAVDIDYNDSIFSGVIEFINFEIINGTVFVKCSIITDLIIRSGSKVSVSTIINTRENAIVLPLAAVFMEENKYYVNVVADNNEITQTEVVVGITNDHYIEILNGIDSGVKVAVDDD